uniref:ADP-ribosylation factor 2 n=1 Tax=Graphocephala atropunctata TaxID=36148 RepID=A0A1B6L5H4_9HEMI
MGLTLSNLFEKLFEKKQMKLLMLGLDAAGKTTILYNLKLGEVVTTIPTVGFNVETLDYNNVSFTVWDIGGQEKIRQLWRFYFDDVQGIIFVIDCNDLERLDDAAKELKTVLEEPKLQHAALLVFANKQDLPRAVTSHDLIDKLDLNKLSARTWHVQPSVANKCHGLHEGFEWLSDHLTKL